MADKDFSDVSWREYVDRRRNRGFDAVDRRVQRLRATKFGDGPGSFALDLVGKDSEGRNVWSIFGEEYHFPIPHGDANESPFPERYMWYWFLVTGDGGTPTEYERPTAEGWE